MNILITGGAGYIGSHLAVEFLNNGHNVIIVDDLSNSEEFIIDNIINITKKEPVFYAYNCSNERLMDQIFSEHKINVVIHTAAKISISQSVTNPIDFFDNNINSLLTITKVMVKHNVKKLIYSSSATAYGIDSKELMVETMIKKHAIDSYSVSKQIGEDILFTLNDNINTAIIRYFNPIGCHPSGLIGSIPTESGNNIINSLFNSKYKNEQFKINGDNYKTTDGTCVRDYINVIDLARAHNKILNWLIDSNKTEIFNLCTGNGTSVLKLINIFEDICGEKLNTIIGNRRKGDSGFLVGSTEKIKNIFNFTPKYDIIQSIKDYQKWYDFMDKKILKIKNND